MIQGTTERKDKSSGELVIAHVCRAYNLAPIVFFSVLQLRLIQH